MDPFSSPSHLTNNVFCERTATNNKNKVASYLSDVLLMVGNSMIAGGNTLLYRYGALPLIPASCFIIEGVINSKIAMVKLIRRYRNSKTINNSVLKWISLSTLPFLPIAVLYLNLPKPNPATLPVTYAFGTGAVTSVLNHTAAAFEKGKEDLLECNQEDLINQQPTLSQKIVSTAISLSSLMTITSVIIGVSLFADYELSNSNHDDSNKSFFDKEVTAFSQIITGLVFVGLGELINTTIKYREWCFNRNDGFNIENISTISTSSTESLLTPPPSVVSNKSGSYDDESSSTETIDNNQPFNVALNQIETHPGFSQTIFPKAASI